MGFGAPPSHIERIRLVGSRRAARMAAIETCGTLSWKYEQSGADFFTVRIGISGTSWGETLTVSIDAGETIVESKGTLPQLCDWGKNKRNVREFADRFSIKEARDSKIVDGNENFLRENTSPVERLTRGRTDE